MDESTIATLVWIETRRQRQVVDDLYRDTVLPALAEVVVAVEAGLPKEAVFQRLEALARRAAERQCVICGAAPANGAVLTLLAGGWAAMPACVPCHPAALQRLTAIQRGECDCPSCTARREQSASAPTVH